MQTNGAGITKLKTEVQLIWASIFCLLLSPVTAPAQSQVNGSFKRFRAPLEYFPPPHDLQVKSFLEGAEAVPGADGLIYLRDAKLQTFQENGTNEMTVIAPNYTFDTKQQTVNSAGPLQVQTDDNRLLLKGAEGFIWRQTNSDLFISNRVDTFVSGTLTNSFTP